MEEQGANSTMFFKNRHPPSKRDKKAVHGRDFCVLAAVLVVVCVLLLVIIAARVYLTIMMTNHYQQLMEQKSELENRTQLLSQQLMEQKSELENCTQDPNQQRDVLNWTFGIMKVFECQPCPKEWIPFKDHCYFFFNEASSWKQWDQSQTYCKTLNPISDLVVIESLEEQKFIHNHTQYYFDKFHGFWIGLSQNSNNRWVWVDGQTDTLGFWMKKDWALSGPKALMIPNQPLNESWSPAKNGMQNKFICESRALIKV